MVFIVLIFTSCTMGVDLESVDYKDLFTDSNSKVWLVNKLIIDNANFSPTKISEKDILIFHDNGHCDYVSLSNLNRKTAKKGYFTLYSKERKMSIDFKDEGMWDLTIPYLTEDSIFLKATDASEIVTSVQLIPFPEL